MSTNKDPIFLETTFTKCVQILPADTTDKKIIYTAGADGGAVTQLSASTDDTSQVIAEISVSDGTTEVKLGEVVIPAGSGTDGSSPSKNLLDVAAMPGSLQADGSLLLGPAAVLSVNAKATITAAKVFDIVGHGGSYTDA